MVNEKDLEAMLRLSADAKRAFGIAQAYLKTELDALPLEDAVPKLMEGNAAVQSVDEIRDRYKRLVNRKARGENAIDAYVFAETEKGLQASRPLEEKVKREAKNLSAKVKGEFKTHYDHFQNAAEGMEADCRALLKTYAALHEQFAEQFNMRDGLLARYYAFAKDMEPIDAALGKAKADYASTQFDQHTLLILRNSLQQILQAYSATTSAYKPFGIFPRKTPFDYAERVAEARALEGEIRAAISSHAAYQQLTGAEQEFAAEPGSPEELQQMQKRAAQYRAEAGALAQRITNNREASATLGSIDSFLYRKERQYSRTMQEYQQLSADCQELERIAGSSAKLAEAAQKRDVAGEAARIRAQLDGYAAKTYTPAKCNSALIKRKNWLTVLTQQYLQEAQGYTQRRADEKAAEQAREQARTAEEQKMREAEKDAEEARAVAEAESIVRQHGTFTAFLSSLKPRNPAYYGLLESLRDPTRNWAECLERMSKCLSAIGPASCSEDIGFIEKLSRGLRKASEDTGYSYLAQKVAESQKCRAHAESALSALAMYASGSRAALATPAMPALAPS